MASNYSVTFSILGNLDPSLQNALNGAAKNIKSLSDLAKSINPKAISQARALQNAQATLKAVEAYNKLSGAIKTNQAALAANLLLASKQRAQQSAAVKQLGDMKAAYQRLNDVYKANRRSLGSDAAQVMKEQLKAARAELKAQQKLVDDLGKQSTASSAKAQKLRETLAAQQNQLSQMRSTLPHGINTSAEAALRAQVEATTQALNREIAAIERRNQVLANFSQANQDLVNAWSNFQSSLQTAQTLMNPFQSAAENAMTFEKSMSRLKSLTQMRNLRAGDMAAVEREMATMTSTIEHLGAASEFTANQIAGAANKYAMSGWTPEQINAMLPTTTDLASIAQIPIDRVADMVSDDMTAFGIKAGQSYRLAGGKVVDGAQYFGDAVAYATTQANMDLTTFHEAWKYNAPTAHAMKLSLGEAVAQNMVAANAGIKGSMSGTSFRQFWVRLSAPPKTAQKSMEEMGMTASDATKTIREMQEAMAEAGVDQSSDLFTKIEALEQYYQSGLKAGRDMTGWLKGLTGQTALSGVQSLFDTGKLDEAKRYKQEIDSGFIEGWAGETASVMRDNTQTAIDYLTSAADALQRSAGQALLPAIRSVAEAFTPLVASAAQWVAQNPAIVQACAAIATSLSGIIVSAAAVKLAFAGWGFITSAITLVRTALAGLGSGAMLSGLIGRIAALRTALFGLGGAATLGGWSAMFAAIATSARTAMTAVTGFFASLSVSSMASGAIAALRSVGTAILGAARAAMMFAFSPVGVALMALALAGMYCYQNWDRVAPVLSMIADIVTGALAPAFNQIKAAIEGFASSGGFTALQSIVTSLANTVGGKLVNAFLVLLSVAASVIAGLIQLFADLITIALDFGTGLSEAFAKIKSGEVMGALDALQSAGKKVSDDISKLGDHTFDSFIQGAKNVQNVLSALDMPKLPTQEVTARHRVEFNESGQAPTPAQIQPTTDALSQIPAQIQPTTDALSQIPAQIQPTTDALSQIPAQIQPTTDALSQIPAQIQPTTDALSQIPAQIQPTTDALSQIPAQIQPTTDALSQIPAQIQPTTDALSQFPASLEPVTTALADFPSSLEPVTSALDQMAEGMIEAVRAMSDALLQLGTEALNAATQLQTDTVALQMFGAATVTDTVALQMLGAASLATFVAIQMLGAAALGAYTGVANLGEAAGGAAIQVSGLGEAAQSACAQLVAAGASAAAQVSAAVSSIKVEHNAEGGIYQRGAFLTTFAEKSPEAAIPLDGSKRAQSLWRTAGQMLGILPNDGRRPNWSIKRVPRIGGLKMPRITFPTMTPPTFPEERPMPRLSIPQGGGDLPPINVTIHVMINGNADEQVVRRGIETAMPSLQRSFTEELRDWRRERARRSFA